MSKSQKKLIVLTGATRGLGQAMALEFARLGHTVAGCGRNKDKVQILAQTLGKPHSAAVVDVAVDDDVRRWSHDILNQYGAPDLLLNNAAVITRNNPLWEVSAAEFAEILDINITGVVNVIRHFVPAMINVGRGVILNFSSAWGRSASAEVAPYCATKWAVEGLTKALAQELPPGIAAATLNPGIIRTDMLRTCFGKKADAYHSPQSWIKSAAPYILSINTKHNGKQLSVP